MRPTGWSGPRWTVPRYRVDVSRRQDELVVEAALPGIEPDEVDLTVDNGRLTIRAETVSEATANGRRLPSSRDPARRLQPLDHAPDGPRA